MQKNLEKKLKFITSYPKDDILLLYKINNIIRERNLLQPNQKILIAVSAGQDSLCLLKTLFFLKKKWNWKLGIVHCDHRWNNTSRFQARHVAYLAFSMQLDYYEGIATKFVQREGIARLWRYNLIQIVAVSTNYTAIITGHTASDRVETLVYNLIRGSGLHGLQSINWKRDIQCSLFTHSPIFRKKSAFFFKKLKYRKTFDRFCFDEKVKKNKSKQLHLIRPLLEITRKEIRNVVNIWNFPSWPDGTNTEIQYRRNRIRHRVIPYLRLYYNPKIDQTLARWTEVVQSETIYLEKITNFLFLKIERKKKIPIKDPIEKNFNFYQSALPLKWLRSVPLAIQRRILKKYISSNTGKSFRFQYIEQIRLSCLFHSNISRKVRKNQGEIPWLIFPGGIALVIRNSYIYLFFQKEKFDSPLFKSF